MEYDTNKKIKLKKVDIKINCLELGFTLRTLGMTRMESYRWLVW